MKKVLLFDLGKYTEMRLSEVHIFLVQKRLLPIEKISKQYLKVFFFCPIREHEKHSIS